MPSPERTTAVTRSHQETGCQCEPEQDDYSGSHEVSVSPWSHPTSNTQDAPRAGVQKYPRVHAEVVREASTALWPAEA